MRALFDAWDEKDLAALIREWYGDADESAAIARVTHELAAQEPGWSHFHPDVVWDMAATGVLGGEIRGLDELILWWRDWAGSWESYITRLAEIRDLGDCALVALDLDACGRDGIPVRMRAFQLVRVRDGKVSDARSFVSEAEALEAAR